MERRTKIILFLSGLTLGAVIVSSAWLFSRQEHALSSETTPPTATKEATSETLPLPTLTNTSRKDTSTTTRMTIEMTYPTVTIMKHGDIEMGVNTAIKKFTDDIVEGFKQEEIATDMDGVQESFESSLTMNWDPMLVSPEIISIRFNYSAYSAGAAHPNNMSRVLNYDLEQGKILQTEELFRSPSEALPFLSAFSRDALRKTMKDLSREEFSAQALPGTEPTVENFKEVALTKEGLIVIFNPYQVASYARGTQDILVGKNELTSKLTNTVQNALRDAE